MCAYLGKVVVILLMRLINIVKRCLSDWCFVPVNWVLYQLDQSLALVGSKLCISGIKVMCQLDQSFCTSWITVLYQWTEFCTRWIKFGWLNQSYVLVGLKFCASWSKVLYQLDQSFVPVRSKFVPVCMKVLVEILTDCFKTKCVSSIYTCK